MTGWAARRDAPATRTRGPAQKPSRALAWVIAAGAIFALAGGVAVVSMRGQSAAASRSGETPLPEAARAGVAAVSGAAVAPAASAAATVVASEREHAPDVDAASHALAGPAPKLHRLDAASPWPNGFAGRAHPTVAARLARQAHPTGFLAFGGARAFPCQLRSAVLSGRPGQPDLQERVRELMTARKLDPLVVAAVLTFAGAATARADGGPSTPTKDQCIAANAEAQSLRRAGKFAQEFASSSRRASTRTAPSSSLPIAPAASTSSIARSRQCCSTSRTPRVTTWPRFAWASTTSLRRCHTTGRRSPSIPASTPSTSKPRGSLQRQRCSSSRSKKRAGAST